MNIYNDSTETTSDDERIEQLLAANEALDKANEQLRAELALEQQQLASAQQQLAALSQQLAILASAGTEPMMPIGEHHFDVSKIAALTWDRSTPELPAVCVDGTAVWRPARTRPALNTTMEITDQMRVELPARVEAWEAECQAAKEQILVEINAAKEALKSRRRRR